MAYRIVGKNAVLEVMLVTSRVTKRWIIPKGNVDFHMSPHQAAAQEALEEAGVFGEICHKPVGVFHYPKMIARGVTVRAKVVVFPLAVTGVLDDWQEKGQRERCWFTRQEAISAVQEVELADIIRKFQAN